LVIQSLIIAALNSLLFVFGCNGSSGKKDNTIQKSDTIKSVKNINDYFPVQEGFYREYITEAPREETEKYKAEVNTIKDTDDGITSEFKSFPYFSKKEEAKTIKIYKDGSVTMYENGKENKFIPATDSMKVGYIWDFDIWRGYIVGFNETIKTDAGSFENCLHISYSASITFQVELWLAKGVGIVKWASYRTNPPTPFITYYILKNKNN
jgi:hypothetical protein